MTILGDLLFSRDGEFFLVKSPINQLAFGDGAYMDRYF